MSTETDTTSEVARVLNLHASFKASAEIQDPNTPWYWECDGCDARLALSGTYGRPEVVAALAKHQAAMLAEAGLLRPAGTDHLAEDLRENTEALIAARARLSDLTGRIGFGDGVSEPQADNDTIVKAVNEAFTNSNTLWEVEEQVERVRALADHYEARQGTALGRVSTGNVAASIRRALGPQDPQIAASVPAGQPAAGSAGRGGSGGTCARCGAGITLPAGDPENREMAVCMPCEIAVFKEGWKEARERLAMLRELAGAIRANSHCSHLATDIETLLDTRIEELRALDETNEEGA